MINFFISQVFATCPHSELIEHGHVVSKELHETSGLVVYKKKLWLHNDSGDKPRLFSVDTQKNVEEVHAIPIKKAFDWEDIAIDRANSIVFIADTGDNRESGDNHCFTGKSM